MAFWSITISIRVLFYRYIILTNELQQTNSATIRSFFFVSVFFTQNNKYQLKQQLFDQRQNNAMEYILKYIWIYNLLYFAVIIRKTILIYLSFIQL